MHLTQALHTHNEGILVLATKFPKETSSRLIHWDDYKEYVTWYSHVLTFLPLFAACILSMFPCHTMSNFDGLRRSGVCESYFYLLLLCTGSILCYPHTHSSRSAGKTPSWPSRTTDCGEQTNKHDFKTFCTVNSQISPDLCLPWHDCYNQQRQPWDYTKITWDIIIKSVGKIRH